MGLLPLLRDAGLGLLRRLPGAVRVRLDGWARRQAEARALRRRQRLQVRRAAGDA